MNQSIFQLLGNVVSADFYLCEDNDIDLISDNNAYNMKALVQEALKLRVPNSLTVIDLNNFYAVMIPIDHNQTLIVIPHINTTNIPVNYRDITKFITNIHSLSALAYQLMTHHRNPQWKTHIKKVPVALQSVSFPTNNEIGTYYANEQLILRAIKDFDFNRFNEALNTPTLTKHMGETFETNNYVRGEKDILIRFVALLIDTVIKSGQVKVEDALKVQDDILGTIEFKKDQPPFTIWMKLLAIECFKRLNQIKSETTLSLAEQVALYIQNHVNQKLSLALLAKKFECSDSSLAHLFKEKYNVTVGAYINSHKVDAAKYMLTNSHISISEIAYVLAFNSPSYFMKVFKRTSGMTTTRYRKTHSQ